MLPGRDADPVQGVGVIETARQRRQSRNQQNKMEASDKASKNQNV